MTPDPVLLVFSGLPGTGKTTLARACATRLAAVYLRIDSIEQALARSTLRIRPAEDAGYVAAGAVARDNLRTGLGVVVDCVNPITLSRRGFAALADEVGVRHRAVEVVCSDPVEHRRRVETRSADGEGATLPRWDAVLARDWEPWETERLVVDTARLSVDEAVARIVAHALGDERA